MWWCNEECAVMCNWFNVVILYGIFTLWSDVEYYVL